MRKKNPLFVSALLLGCVNSHDSGSEKNKSGLKFIDLKIGSTWNYENTDVSRLNARDLVRRGVELLEINSDGDESLYVFEINDTVYSNRNTNRVDSMRLDTIYKIFDTAAFKHSLGSATGVKSTISDMSFFPPTMINLDSQITIDGLYSEKVGKSVNLNGSDIYSATFFQQTDRPQGIDSTVYLQGIGLYYRKFNWAGGITAQALNFRLMAHNGKPIFTIKQSLESGFIKTTP